MGKGYAEGSALEERLAELERSGIADETALSPLRHAVYGSTAARPEKHFIGWRDEVDPDELFRTGAAWGITIVRRSEPAP
jgi:hypothetical protein